MGNPDEFMFRLFELHSKALRTHLRDKYFVLSSGTNEFPAPRLYKQLWQLEIERDLFYRFYTLQDGYPAVVECLKLCENTIATGDVGGAQPFPRLCVTAGASGAVAGVFRWLGEKRVLTRVLLLGLNYSLFARCAARYKWPVMDLVSEEPGRIFPSVQEIEAFGRRNLVDLVVIALPGNPSGEMYTEAELRFILQWARTKGAFVLIDRVGLDEMLAPRPGKWVNIGRIVMEEEAVDYTIIVNSISKTRSLPGARFGYLMGSAEVVDAVSELTRTTAMNPPIQLVLPVCMDALCRALTILEHEGRSEKRDHLLTMFRRLFLVTNAMSDQRGRLIQELFTDQSVSRYYNELTDELNRNYDQIERNRQFALAALEPHVELSSSIQSGFNMAVRFTPFTGADEYEVCRTAFETRGIALFPEACFRYSPRHHPNFWVRVSLASPPDVFESQIRLLREYLDAFATCS